MQCKVTQDLNAYLAAQDAAELAQDRADSTENDIRSEVMLKLLLTIDNKDWSGVYTICDEHHFNFDEWATETISQDSAFGNELRDALFYREPASAPDVAATLIEKLDFTTAVSDRIALEDDLTLEMES